MLARTLVTSRLTQFGAALSFVALLHTPAHAQADPLVGTWTLNVAKSKYTPGPAPKNQTSVYAAVAGGYHVSTSGVDATGKAIKTEYTAKVDGTDAPVTGSADYDMASLKRTDAHSLSLTRKKGGKVVQTGTIVVAADGKTRTVTIDGTNASGAKTHTVALYEKK